MLRSGIESAGAAGVEQDGHLLASGRNLRAHRGAVVISATSGVEEAVSRKSALLDPEGFAVIFDQPECLGKVFHSLARPGPVVREGGGVKDHGYGPCIS